MFNYPTDYVIKHLQKGHRTRCSPFELAKTYIDLIEQKLALVHEMGFGTLVENVSNYYFNNLIMMELADSFHIPDSTIRTNIGNFKINATKVGNAFGLNSWGGLYRQKMLKKDVPATQYKAVNAFRGKTLADLRDMVYTIKLDSEENITLFKRAFILYVQKAVLCPNNSNPISPKILPTILDVSNTREMNWGRHVYSFLLDGITESRRKNTKHIDDSTLKERIQYEFKDPAESNLIKSLEIEAAKGKKILEKRKQIEEEEEETASSHYESESASDPESESELENSSDSDPDSERTVSEDETIPEVENVGVVKRRTKRRHENMNANAMPPPHVQGEHNAGNEDVVQQPQQNAGEDNNAAAASDVVVGSSSQLTVNLSSDVQDRNANPAAVPTATKEIVHESGARDTASVAGAAMEVEGVKEENTQPDNTLEHTQDGDSEIVYASFEDPSTSVEEEATLTSIVQKITTQQHNDTLEDAQRDDATIVHFSVADPTTSVEKETPFATIVQNIATQQHDDMLEDTQDGNTATLHASVADPATIVLKKKHHLQPLFKTCK
ncbi:hypothetical protein PIB30_042902 [Stylosanthes scabra]|uniref:Uncharacterized protein n=1 Tax=Stylosanthes scabra TaxID=79078 RepID=A0ABU6TFK4_9FABA|nr:hypothetical protein [Stylosanthes scabra]